MAWSEFRDLLTGLSSDTALARVVAIRSEEDREVLKRFTPEQRRIRSEWRNRVAKQRSSQDVNTFLAQMQTAFRRMSGNGGEGA